MFPCIKEEFLSIFSGTADQRSLLGEETFLKTHLPIIMKRFIAKERTEIWKEDDLYQELMSNNLRTGNRVYVLYGAAGSGKSETLRWLFYKLSNTSRQPYILRISRTELDPVLIMQKLLMTFKGIELEEIIHQNWDELRKKPVTLANHLVWATLGKLLPSDEEVIPLSYQLRPLLEQNLILNFSGIDNPYDFKGRTAELISIEDIEKLKSQCSIPIELNSEQLHYEMAREFEKAVLGGYNFVETLRSISISLTEQGIRPVLLIDDLVQSLNIYSAEIIDFLITIEEGNWDVVFGLTPASFETSKRGKELLKRISNLDTFDDRMTKLWLSDEQGNMSYFLNQDNCHQIAMMYLQELKSMAGFSCSVCVCSDICNDLQMGTFSDGSLAPFNRPFLKRVFSSLPQGKGKARYFILTLGEILKRIARGDIIYALENYVQREIAVDYPDKLIRLIGETYSPETVKDEGIVYIKSTIQSLFLGKKISEDLELSASSLVTNRSFYDGSPDNESSFGELNSGKEAIRDWLEGSQVNKELLKGFRLGVAHLCREVLQPNMVIPPSTSRTSPLLKWEESLEGSRLPIRIEGIDNFKGISCSKEIGHSAFLLNYLHLKRGQAKELSMQSALQTSDYLHYLLYEASIWKEEIKNKLIAQLTIPIDETAFLLFIILVEIGQVSEVPGILKSYNYNGHNNYPEPLEIPCMPQELTINICNLFKDWFMLRENIYDAVRLEKLINKYRNVDPIIEIFKIDPEKISPQFKIGQMEFRNFVRDIQEWLNNFVTFLKSKESFNTRWEINNSLNFLEEISYPDKHLEIRDCILLLSRKLGQPVIHLDDWQQCTKLKNKFKRVLKGYLDKDFILKLELTPIQVHRLFRLFSLLELENSFTGIKESLKLIYTAETYVNQAKNSLITEVKSNNLEDYFQLETNQEDSFFPKKIEYYKLLMQLQEELEKIEQGWKLVNILKQTIMYIDEELFHEADYVLKVFGEQKDKIKDIPTVVYFLKNIIDDCGVYVTIINDLQTYQYESLNSDIISDLMRVSTKLGSGGLKNQLSELHNQILRYFHSLLGLSRVFTLKDNESFIQNRIEPLKQASIESIREVCDSLLEALTMIDELNSLFFEELKETINNPMLNFIFQMDSLEFTLNSPNLKELIKLMEEYPELGELIYVTLKVS